MRGDSESVRIAVPGVEAEQHRVYDAMIRPARKDDMEQTADIQVVPSVVEQEWHTFDNEYLIFCLLSKEHRQHARRAFYSGAWSVYNRIVKEFSSSKSPEEVADWLQRLAEDLASYGKSVMEGKE